MTPEEKIKEIKLLIKRFQEKMSAKTEDLTKEEFVYHFGFLLAKIEQIIF